MIGNKKLDDDSLGIIIYYIVYTIYYINIFFKVVTRDIKPDNIVLTSYKIPVDGTDQNQNARTIYIPKLIDFGISRDVTDKHTTSSAGTLEYMIPEFGKRKNVEKCTCIAARILLDFYATCIVIKKVYEKFRKTKKKYDKIQDQIIKIRNEYLKLIIKKGNEAEDYIPSKYYLQLLDLIYENHKDSKIFTDYCKILRKEIDDSISLQNQLDSFSEDVMKIIAGNCETFMNLINKKNDEAKRVLAFAYKNGFIVSKNEYIAQYLQNPTNPNFFSEILQKKPDDEVLYCLSHFCGEENKKQLLNHLCLNKHHPDATFDLAMMESNDERKKDLLERSAEYGSKLAKYILLSQ